MGTPVLYVGDDGPVMTGCGMDWAEDMRSNLSVFPRGMQRDGVSGPKSVIWTLKYGSLCVSSYDLGTVDSINEAELVIAACRSGELCASALSVLL